MMIKEVIVVEGKHDSATLKQYFEVDTIETNGSALTKATIEYIKEVKEKRGIIIFTDPDFSGERLRRIINQKIDGCKNAFIDKQKALGNHKVGIEHATKYDLEEALKNVVSFDSKIASDLEKQDLCLYGLDGDNHAAYHREIIGNKLKIGKCNAKTFYHRLKLMGIKKVELEKLWKELINHG